MGNKYAGSLWVPGGLTKTEAERFKALLDKFFLEGNFKRGMTGFQVAADEGWEPPENGQ